MTRTQYTIYAVAVSQEHSTRRLSNSVDTKNKISKRARQLQSIADGTPPGEATRLLCLSRCCQTCELWMAGFQQQLECDFLTGIKFGVS